MASASCTRLASSFGVAPEIARSSVPVALPPSVAAVANGGGPIAGAMMLTNGPTDEGFAPLR